MSTAGQAGEVSLGRQRAPKYHHGDGMRPYLRVANVFEDRIDTTDVMQMTFSDDEFERYRLQTGDVLLNEGQSPHLLGRPAIYRGHPPDVAFTNSLIRFRAGPGVTPEWALAVFRHCMHSRRFMRESRITTNIAHLSATRFSTVEFPVPPVAEQQRIVAAIEEQFSQLDAGVAALDRARQNLKRMRAAALQAAVSGRLVHQDLAEGTGTDFLAMVAQRRERARSSVVAASANLSVPETWTVASLEAVTDPHRVICYGILMPKVRQGGTVPYVEVKDLRARRLDVGALHRTSAELHNEFSRSQLNTGDVVLAIRGSYDRALVVPADVAGANVSRDVARIAPLPGIDASFVAAYLMSPPALQYLRQRARGVAVKGVNIADLRSMPIPVPPQEEQNRIVRELDRIDSIIGDLESVLDSERVRATTLRSSILAAAFSGNLLPQDPLDEPASALLERIAAERTASNGHNLTRSRKPPKPGERITT